MANTPKRLIDRFLVLSGDGKVQPDKDTGLLDADLDTRDACTITVEEVISRLDIRDCKGMDLADQKIRTRALRFTFTYKEVTPQILTRWNAYYLGAATVSAVGGGGPANEVQTLTRTGTVSGGTFTLSETLEGFNVVTRPIAWDASLATINAAVTEARMNFIQPGDVVATGDWTTGIILTFGGRLAHANLPLMTVDNTNITGGGTIGIAGTTNGSQNHHELSRADSNVKQRFSIGLGWDDVTDRVEKYVGLVCESFQPGVDRRQAVTLTVSCVSPWEPEILTGFSIPECVSIDALMSDDTRLEIDGEWETSDLNTERYNLNDNVALDEASAFPFAGVDVTDLQRGDQPTYEITAGVFGSEVDTLYQTALNERTADPVDYRTHFGQPGNRFSLITPNTKIKFQNNRLGTAGALNESVIQITGTPYKVGATLPISAEAYIDQDTAFLVVSE